MSKVFLDTNVLVYMADTRDKAKQKRCRALYADLASEQRAVVSTQVLQEYFVSLVTKLGSDPLAAKQTVQAFENLEVVTVSPRLIHEAIDVSILNRISFWDGLIVAAAATSKCATLLTEDLKHGAVIRGVRIQNPFARH